MCSFMDMPCGKELEAFLKNKRDRPSHECYVILASFVIHTSRGRQSNIIEHIYNRT